MQKYKFLILLCFLIALSGLGKVLGQCTSCTVTLTASNNPAINDNDVVCVTANRTANINFNNSSGITICINSGVTLPDSRITSLSGLSFVNNYGNLTIADKNGNWTINNFGSLTYSSSSIGSSKAINNFGTFTRSGSLDVSGSFFSSGNSTITGALIVNSTGNIKNTGTLTVSGNITNSGSFDSSSGTVTTSGNLTNNSTGVFLIGNGTISGAVTNNGNITISGSLSVTGSFGQNSSGITQGFNNQCNTLNVNGNITSLGTITGNDQTIGGGLLSGLVVNKNPTSGSLSGGAIVSSTLTCPTCGTSYTYSAPGINTFYVPEGVTQITIEMVGGGGRGGNRTSSGRSGGGGGGAYSSITVDVTPGESLGVFVGAGGNLTTPNGGISYVTRDPTALPVETGSILFAGGGIAGADGDASTNGGAGGISDSRSDRFSFSGGIGATGTGTGPGGGGSSGGNSSNGNNGGISGGGADPSGIGGPGGNGNPSNNQNGFAPVSGYGGGGGGGRRTGTNGNGGFGSSGYVIISYTCPSINTCSNILSYGASNGYTIIEYTCDAIWNAPEGLLEFEVLAIGGGAGGGGRNDGGGGGAGGVIYARANIESRFSEGLPSGISYLINVANGGSGGTSENSFSIGIDGEDTSFDLGGDYEIIAGGGGGGGSTSSGGGRNGRSSSIATTLGFGTTQPEGILRGGSGGGSRRGSGAGSGSNGNSGTNGSNSGNGSGGGGGGANGNAGTSGGSNNGRPGGSGQQFSNSIFNTSNYFSAGGGGGGSTGGAGGSSGAGGNGGSGNGMEATSPGSGGGGASDDSNSGGRGSDGRVFIRYANFRILPVEFLTFTATSQPQDKSALLEWTTSKEWENSHFEIERSINDVKSWTVIDQVEGNGYSDITVDYTYTDLKLPISGGNIFYRLKQVDFDGTFIYSNTKAIQVEPVEGTSHWIVYPNPTSGNEIYLKMLSPANFHDEQVSVRIISASGNFDVIEGSSSAQISSLLSDKIRGKSAGIYTLEIHWGNNWEYHKIILSQ